MTIDNDSVTYLTNVANTVFKTRQKLELGLGYIERYSSGADTLTVTMNNLRSLHPGIFEQAAENGITIPNAVVEEFLAEEPSDTFDKMRLDLLSPDSENGNVGQFERSSNNYRDSVYYKGDAQTEATGEDTKETPNDL